MCFRGDCLREAYARKGVYRQIAAWDLSQRVPEQYRARLTGLYSVTYSIGFSLGPAASGQLQKVGGFTPAFLMGTACYFCGATLLYLFFGRDRTLARVAVESGVA